MRTSMHNLGIVVMVWSLVMSACARYNEPSSGNLYTNADAVAPGATGGKSPETGLSYVSPDPRVGSTQFVETAPSSDGTSPSKPAATAQPPGPKGHHGRTQTQTSPQPEVKPADPGAPQTLKDRLKEFDISRFDDDPAKYKRFGDKAYILRIFFRGLKEPLIFKGQLNGGKDHFLIHDSSGTYTLSGTLDDVRDLPGDPIPNKTRGDFDLVDSRTHESAKIFYWAYETNLRLREDADKPIPHGSDAENQLESLMQKDSFAWWNNWSVESHGSPGVSFFLADIIQPVHGEKPQANQADPKVFTFKGESTRIENEPQSDDSLTPAFKEVKTYGNAAIEGLHLISAQVVDNQSKETYEFALDLEEKRPRPVAATTTPGQPTATDGDPDNDGDWYDPSVGSPAPSPAPTTQPGQAALAPATPGTKPHAAPARPAVGNSYIPIDVNLVKTRKMNSDLLRSTRLPGVQKWLRKFKASSTLREFYLYAYPFRDFLATLAQTYDVAPVFAYLPMNESHYFQARYLYDSRQIADNGLAYGPYQMHPDAAKDASVRATGRSDDERFFYAPSSCGAANLVSQKVRPFMKTDTRFSILAYNQGGKGAMNYARRFKYTYDTFSRGEAYSALREYVDKQIAIYLISADLSGNGFSLASFVNHAKPRNNSVMPPNAIHDPTCRAVVQSAQLD